MEQTHKEFIKTNLVFQKACELARIPTTVRQASKYRRGFGLAFKFRTQASNELKSEAGV